MSSGQWCENSERGGHRSAATIGKQGQRPRVRPGSPLGLAAGLLLLLPSVASAEFRIVYPDGSGLYPTIQAAIDASVNGDEVRLSDGTFRGNGNRDLDLHGKAILIRSASDAPAQCVLDCEGAPGAPHRGFHFHSAEGAGSVLRGLTISGGFAELGGGLLVEDAGPWIIDCVIAGNAAVQGGGVARVDGFPVFRSVTITDNRADRGGGFYTVGAGWAPQLWDSILWGNCAAEGSELYLDDGAIALYCTCFGWPGVDGFGFIGYSEWFFDDPCFCGPRVCEEAPFSGGDYTISVLSSCTPRATPCRRLVGALGIGCSPTPVETVSWGSVKHRWHPKLGDETTGQTPGKAAAPERECEPLRPAGAPGLEWPGSETGTLQIP